MSFRNISFILHKPQLSENIGACARALKNFSFNKLIVVNPKPVFPNDKIIATSVGAKDIIKNAKVFESLEKSLNNIDIWWESLKPMMVNFDLAWNHYVKNTGADEAYGVPFHFTDLKIFYEDSKMAISLIKFRLPIFKLIKNVGM